MNLERAIIELSEKGWTATDDFFSADLCMGLRQQIECDSAAGLFKQAGFGRGKTFQVDPESRADHIKWLDDYDRVDAIDEAKAAIDQFRIEINRALFLGLNDFEGHLTVYPPGSGYMKHVDRFTDKNTRTLSFITYLNDLWHPEDGGALRIFAKDNTDLIEAEVLPLGGRMIAFISNEIHHQVLPNCKPRFSLTGWYLR